MSSDMFCDAVYQLADLWTDSLEPTEYVTFLMDLLEKMKKVGLGKGLLEGKESGPPRASFLRKVNGELRLNEKLQALAASPRGQESSSGFVRRPRRHSIESFLPPGLPPSTPRKAKQHAGTKLPAIPADSLPTVPATDAQEDAILRISQHVFIDG